MPYLGECHNSQSLLELSTKLSLQTVASEAYESGSVQTSLSLINAEPDDVGHRVVHRI